MTGLLTHVAVIIASEPCLSAVGFGWLDFIPLPLLFIGYILGSFGGQDLTKIMSCL